MSELKSNVCLPVRPSAATALLLSLLGVAAAVPFVRQSRVSFVAVGEPPAMRMEANAKLAVPQGRLPVDTRVMHPTAAQRSTAAPSTATTDAKTGQSSLYLDLAVGVSMVLSVAFTMTAFVVGRVQPGSRRPSEMWMMASAHGREADTLTVEVPTGEECSAMVPTGERYDTFSSSTDGDDADWLKQFEMKAPRNYYELLEVPRTASSSEMKSQYRKIQKICHPDVAGDAAVDVCLLLNDAIETLTDENKKAIYDAQLEEMAYQERLLHLGATGFEGYTGKPYSPFYGSDPVLGSGDDSRAVFVDESRCIGCRQCNHLSPSTFGMEDVWGRARCKAQWADTEENINNAILSCPVDCIHFVRKGDLADLEFVMRNAKRATVASMMAGGATGDDPFMLAAMFRARSADIRRKYNIPEGTAPLVDYARGAKIANAWLQMEETLRQEWRKLGLPQR
eukprot:EG_transcript_10852